MTGRQRRCRRRKKKLRFTQLVDEEAEKEENIHLLKFHGRRQTKMRELNSRRNKLDWLCTILLIFVKFCFFSVNCLYLISYIIYTTARRLSLLAYVPIFYLSNTIFISINKLSPNF